MSDARATAGRRSERTIARSGEFLITFELLVDYELQH
jgi:hypothetical protein